MNKYRDKSDFEINKAVAVNKLSPELIVEKNNKIYISEGDSGVIVRFDPCNNPADAMPIFIDNKMGVIFLGDLVQVSDFSGGTINFGRNFYRTIAELFLMMKEAENEKV
ncbi:recombinase [Morganella morganii]|uniref:recombinase n=1 Tax=Morganella morganii TaxID=582 RepID=UPI0023DDCF3A|nr:recombinase [Morganella morganii]MDF2407586.1 DUF2591 domain-containing protein [Morganella morganii]